MSPSSIDRRSFLKASLAAPAGVALAHHSGLAQPNPSVSAPQPGAGIPCGKIGNLEVSRLILGGNQIGGWAHGRDLEYLDTLVKHYHTDEKVFQTLAKAEELGVNTFLTNPVLIRVIQAYWKEIGGKIQFISDCGNFNDLMKGVRDSIDAGASAAYVHGGMADGAARNGKIEVIAEAVDLIKSNGLPAGIAAHSIETVHACHAAGLEPDFWMKTLHTDNYFSASPPEERPEWDLPPHDNMWCTDADAVVHTMETLETPWIAFKVLAGGALEPKEAISFAFKSGADFVCVGMFDFQLEEDVALVADILADKTVLDARTRPWRA
jgi:hypothetical protein